MKLPIIATIVCWSAFTLPAISKEHLPSWNDTASKKAIVAFVEKVTKEGSIFPAKK